MIDASQGEVVSSLRAASRLVGRRRPLPIGVFGAGYVLLVLVVGAVSGWIWHSIVTLPSYLTSDDGSVQMTERAQGQIFMLDAVFVVLGMAVGVGLGLAAWQLFRRLGWPVAVIAAGGGLLAGAVCWGVGVLQGPRNFAGRVAAALPGEKIPIDFQLHTASALLVWALGAIIPVMLYANLSREDEPSSAKSSRSGKRRELALEQADEVGAGELD